MSTDFSCYLLSLIKDCDHSTFNVKVYILYCFQADDLVHVYPPFVNFFEMSKDALIRCDKMYPRFHAFLKVKP